MKKTIFTLIALLVAGWASAAEIDLTLEKNWTVESIPKGVVPRFTKNADRVLSVVTNGTALYLTTRKIAFEKGKMFQFEGRIESNAKAQIFLQFYDADGKDVSKAVLCNRSSLPVKPIVLDFVLEDEVSGSKKSRDKWPPSAKTVAFKIVQHGAEKLQLELKDFRVYEINTDW